MVLLTLEKLDFSSLFHFPDHFVDFFLQNKEDFYLFSYSKSDFSTLYCCSFPKNYKNQLEFSE